MLNQQTPLSPFSSNNSIVPFVETPGRFGVMMALAIAIGVSAVAFLGIEALGL